MKNKKTKVAIIIVMILIIALIALAYFNSEFNKKQMALLTTETSKILETDLIESDIDLEIKTEKNYAKVEKAMKEYISKLRNIYVEMEKMVSEINPNLIFSAENMKDQKFDEIDNIIEDYKEKSQNFIEQYNDLLTEEKITDNINQTDISTLNSYYIDLYKDIMLSDIIKEENNNLDEKIKNEKARLYEKLNKIDKVKIFLEENNESWTIKEEKIQFTNLNRMTEYYNLLNQIID